MIDLNQVLSLWPELLGFTILGLAFWIMFRRSLLANSEIISDFAKSNEIMKKSLDGVLERYRTLSEDQVKELDRCRELLRKATDENITITQRYDNVRSELAKLEYEHASMRSMIERLENLVIATGGDVKVISRELTIARESLEKVNTVLQIEDNRGR